jgi:hypothetical protein
MIRIESIKQLDSTTFEVRFVSNGHAQTKQFEYCDGVINSHGADGSRDPEFYDYMGANREFLMQLFRLAKKVIANKPLDLPVEVEEGWPNFSSPTK